MGLGNAAFWDEGQVCSIVGLRSLLFHPQQGVGVPGECESWGEIMPSLSQTWLGPLLLVACLLVSRSTTEEVSENCSHMIGNGHLQFLQQLVSVWPCLPYLLPTGETEAGVREQGQREWL